MNSPEGHRNGCFGFTSRQKAKISNPAPAPTPTAMARARVSTRDSVSVGREGTGATLSAVGVISTTGLADGDAAGEGEATGVAPALMVNENVPVAVS